ncbi:MAG: RecQ family ATP-dependent DNA helicase, partial [Deltaproteobacteria bacterium]|nr:RecQ family ATP-dependent DNA helicase [Deltaproteobacteria bacterium]
GPEMTSVYRRLREGALDLLYVAPERFAMDDFLARLETNAPSFIAIDEAHCISEWGHDFRPDYLALSQLTKRFSSTPIAAFTATATPQVQQDIISRLSMRDPFVVRASFDRPNLFYQVLPKGRPERQILAFIRERPNESGIVYRTTRESVEQTAAYLQEHGVKTLPYHAGLENDVRQRHQEAFSHDRVQVIVATVAFGMGIDKSNVRFVVHGDLPKNIESYYQETGRAGRDGEPAHCLLLFGRGDIPKIRFFIDQINSVQERRLACEKLNRMADYAAFHSCRRVQLLAYFGEEFQKDACGVCDVCVDSFETIDATTEARMALSAMARSGQRFGAGHIVDILMGARNKRIKQHGHDLLKTHGVGRHKDRSFWRYLIDQLIAREYVLATDDLYPVLQLTPKGLSLMRDERRFAVVLKSEEETVRSVEAFEDYNQALFERLRVLRLRLADEQNVPPFVVFSDKSLHDMCRKFPRSQDELLQVSGVGERKLQLYGEAFLEEIRSFSAECPEQVSVPESQKDLDLYKAPEKVGAPSRTKGASREETALLAEQGMSFGKIASTRNLKEQTIAVHLEQLFIDRRLLDIDCQVPFEIRVRIEQAFEASGGFSLKPVVEKLEGAVSYEEARIVRGWLEGKKDEL